MRGWSSASTRKSRPRSGCPARSDRRVRKAGVDPGRAASIRARPTISARRGRIPDGSAIRIALARKVKVNTITAGERLYVDLLPESWSGVVPGLPQEVIDELARRAREAERQLRQAAARGQADANSTVRVKVGTQPTFVRYIFELPPISPMSRRSESPDKLTLNFDQPLQFDLADAKATLPPSLERIDSENDRDTALSRLSYQGQAAGPFLSRRDAVSSSTSAISRYAAKRTAVPPKPVTAAEADKKPAAARHHVARHDTGRKRCGRRARRSLASPVAMRTRPPPPRGQQRQALLPPKEPGRTCRKVCIGCRDHRPTESAVGAASSRTACQSSPSGRRLPQPQAASACDGGKA